MSRLPTPLLVGLGGFAGTIARYSVSLLCGQLALTRYPWATLSVNTLGSFLIGVALSMERSRMSETVFLLLVPGFLGGFTTYSAFAGETALYLRNGELGTAALHFGGMSAACVLAAILGLAIGR